MTKRKEITLAPEPLEAYIEHFDELFDKSNQRPRYAQRDNSKQTKRSLTICARKQKSGKVV